MPPPASVGPMLRSEWVRNVQLTTPAPSASTVTTTLTSGSRASSEAAYDQRGDQPVDGAPAALDREAGRRLQHQVAASAASESPGGALDRGQQHEQGA